LELIEHTNPTNEEFEESQVHFNPTSFSEYKDQYKQTIVDKSDEIKVIVFIKNDICVASGHIQICW